MDALVPAFIVAALAEFGDRTQWLAILLGRRFASPAAVLLGILLAALLNMALASAAGYAIGLEISHTAVQLLTGVALVLAAVGAAFRVKAPPSPDGWRLGALLSSFGAFFILEFGDKTQFVAATIAAGSGSPVLTAIGAAAGVTLANAPAVVLGERWRALLPMAAIRIGVGLVFLVAGIVLAIGALGIS